MRRVRCYECGKVYNFDTDDFCPKCGAFNQPKRTVRIAADGSVVRSDGLNENNHQGSFVHAELHEENKARKKAGLDKDLVKNAYLEMAKIRTGNFSKKNQSAKTTPVLLNVVAWALLILLLRTIFN